MREVLVAGGGVAGLACAWRILQRGGEPLVLEASPRTGGYLRTEDLDGALFEHGPQGFLGETPGVLDTVEKLGLSGELVSASAASARRYLQKGDALLPFPTSPRALLTTPLLSVAARLRILAEPRAAPPPEAEESIRDFAVRRLGKGAADGLVDPVVNGIYAGDPSRLSLDSCFPKLRAMEREHGSLLKAARKSAAGPAARRMHSFRGGMGRLGAALESALGARVRKSAPVTQVERAGSLWRVIAGGERYEAPSLVAALPSSAAGALLAHAAPRVAALGAEIPAAPVAVVGLLFERDGISHPLDGYGYLVPGGGRPVLGCLFESSAFPEHAPDGMALLRVLLGGARNPEAARGTEEAIRDAALAAIRGPLGIRSEPRAWRVVAHESAIPQHELGHLARLARLEEELSHLPGLVLAGASWRGVSVNHLVGEADGLARKALAPRERG